MRAIAVAAVVAFHVWPWAVPGGFVGVDVFFVISGFLISQQLLDESTMSGRVRLAAFWGRRIRRILPAAFAVLLTCLVVLVVAMPRVTWADNLADARAAAAYVVNWQLASRSVDYLGAESAPSLVQHYWSLSVEEQFYVVWPLLLAAVAWMARRRVRAMTVAMLAVAAASFATSLVWTSKDAPVAFFATPTRAWEFAVGGLAAVAVRRPQRRGRLAATAAWFGLALIGCSLAV
ncbi:MAG TPA: acyltransferase, partial [Mycobacteriales bacterium]|nr:acyltransferase [Mycobacteriales bacterium]